MKITEEQLMAESHIFLLYELIVKELSTIKNSKKSIEDMCTPRGFNFNWSDNSLEREETVVIIDSNVYKNRHGLKDSRLTEFITKKINHWVEKRDSAKIPHEIIEACATLAALHAIVEFMDGYHS